MRSPNDFWVLTTNIPEHKLWGIQCRRPQVNLLSKPVPGAQFSESRFSDGYDTSFSH